MPILAYMFAKAALDIPFPKQDILFVPDIVYNFGILDEISSTAYYAGHPMVGYLATEKLLKEGKVPVTELPRVQKNFEEYKKAVDKLTEQGLIKPKIAESPVLEKNFKKKKKYKYR